MSDEALGEVAEDLMPNGAVVRRLWWWSVPDKYAGPARFDTLAEAQANAPGWAHVIHVEFLLDTPGGGSLRLHGGVSTADTMWRRSPRQQEGVRPEIGAVVIESLRSSRWFAELLPKAEPTRENRIADAYAEIVFRNPDDGQFVLLPVA